MTYSTTVCNISTMKWGLNLQEAHLFAWMSSLPLWADRLLISGKDYYHASRFKIAQDMPIISDKADTIYRYMKRLEDKGLIETVKLNGSDYVSFTEKSKGWNGYKQTDEEKSLLGRLSEYSDDQKKSTQIVRSSECSEDSPSLGRSSEQNSEDLPTNSLINNINIIKNKQKENLKNWKDSFEEFYELYGKKVDRNKSEQLWQKMSEDERILAIADAPIYSAQCTDKQYQKSPAVYLRNKNWTDDRSASKKIPDQKIQEINPRVQKKHQMTRY